MARTVLIVEDTDNVAPLEIALSSLDGFGVLVVSNGNDALQLLAEETVELAAVITDINLPLVDGYDLIAAIRRNERYSKLPIVAVSGNNSAEVFSRLRHLGANAFFVKPYSPAELRTTLKGLLHEV